MYSGDSFMANARLGRWVGGTDMAAGVDQVQKMTWKEGVVNSFCPFSPILVR